MSSKVEKIENNTATLEIEVSEEQFEKGISKAYKKNVGRFNIPGFRKGKAPRFMIERYYGEGVFYEDAINEVCPEAYEAAIEEHDLQPVDMPELDIVQIEKGKPFIFKAAVTIKPEVTLGEYNGIEAEKKEYPVTDEDVDKELENMRQASARMINVEDRAAQKDDMVIIDYKGFVGDEQFEGGTAENQTLVLGSGQFIEGFEDQLVGAKADDHVDVKVTFPEDYQAEHLAGKDAVFHVDVKEIKEKELPELDDEFAKDVSEFDTLEELKKDIKEKLEQRAEQRVKGETENEIIKKAVENSEVDIPDVMVEKQIDSMVRDFEIQLMYQGLKMEDYIKYSGSSEEDLRSNLRNDARQRVKTQLVLERIAKVEGISETEEELDQEIEKLAKQFKQEDTKKLKESLGEDELKNLKESIIIRKTVELLVERANIK